MQASPRSHAQKIDQELDNVTAEIDNASANAGAVVLDQTSVGRVSRMDALQQQAMAMARKQRLLQRRRQLLAARDRLAQGTYGRCCACDEDIDLMRLQQDPAVVFCLSCQRERSGP